MKKILIASNLGFYSHGIGFDSYLYKLLKSNSYDTYFALCDGVMSACQMSKFSRIMPAELAKKGQEEVCNKCTNIGETKINDIDKVIKLSKYVNNDNEKFDKLILNIDVNEIRKYKYRDINVGEHAYASTIRYFANLNFINEEYGIVILKKYLISSLIVTDIYFKILEKLLPEIVIAHHGIYTPQGLIIEIAKLLNIKVLTWIKTYRKDTFLFSWNDSYHHEMQNDCKEYKQIKYDPIIKNTVLDYLNIRRYGVSDSIHFNVNPDKVNFNLFPKKYDLLLTSVFWDAQVHYKANLFIDQADWLIKTIKLYADRPILGNLVIRVHPAEETGFIKSRDKAIDRILKEFITIPDNILIINSDSKLSTYELIDNCDSALIYNTKAGIECASLGKPVVVAGDSWIKNCEFVISPKSIDEYFNLIISGNHRKFKFDIELAHKYFYHFYFRRMLEFPSFIETIKDFKYEPSLRSGVIDKIMNRSEQVLIDSIKHTKNVYINRNYYLW